MTVSKKWILLGVGMGVWGCGKYTRIEMKMMDIEKQFCVVITNLVKELLESVSPITVIGIDNMEEIK